MKKTGRKPLNISMAGILAGLIVLVLVIILPFVLSEFLVFLLTEILILGLFGLSVNLLVGHSGMVTFGHGAFYGVGAYTVGILLIKTETPFAIAMLLSPLFAAVFGLVVGVFCIRLTKFYFAMLTLAFGMLIWAVIYKWEGLTGADNGLVGAIIPELISSPQSFFYFTFGVVLLCASILWRVIHSPFGLAMKAIRENSEKFRFLGMNLTIHKLAAFVISAAFAGVSGGLYTAFTRGTFPDFASWVKSGDALVIALIGGVGSFWGPCIGAAVLLLLQQIVTSVFEYWNLVLGIILILLVLFLPEGVMGAFKRLWDLQNVVPHGRRNEGHVTEVSANRD